MRKVRVFMVSCLLAGVTALGATPVTAKVTLPAVHQKAGGKLILHIDDLRLPPNSSGIVRVYADFPDADAETGVDNDHFLGYFTLLARNSKDAAAGVERRRVTLDVSHKKKFLQGKSEHTLTLVPLGKPSPEGASEPSKLTFGRIYLAQK